MLIGHLYIIFGKKFSISNNHASDKPHWLRYCHCAKLVHLIWRSIYSNYLPILKLGYSSFYYRVVLVHWTAITKIPQTDGIWTFIPQSPRGWKVQDEGPGRPSVWERAAPHGLALLTAFSLAGGQQAPSDLFMETLILHRRAFPLRPHHIPKAPPLYNIILGLGSQ